MQEVYTLENLSLRDIKILRMGLDQITIKGVDALFIGSLQMNISNQIKQIQQHIEEKNSPTLPLINNKEKLTTPTPTPTIDKSKK